MENLTQTQSYEDAVLKVVMFWSDKSFRTPMNQNNGGGIAFMLMNTLSMKAQDTVTEDKIKKFENKLTELLMAKQNDTYMEKVLSVDYHPCQMLYDAAVFAGLDPHCFPCKTHTMIERDNTVMAKYQYGGQFLKL